MVTLGPLAFLNPWLLTALAALPVAYFIIRAIPPAPKRVFFPATWLARDIDAQSAQVEATPWWLIMLRLLMLGGLIIALAHPILPPQQRLASEGPVILLIDNDWSAAPDWPARQDALLAFLEQIEAQQRLTKLVLTAKPVAPMEEPEEAEFYSPALAGERIRALKPSPWQPAYDEALTAITETLKDTDASIFYLTSGINHGKAAPFISAMSALAPLDIAEMGDAALRQIGFAAVKPSGQGFDVLLIRREAAPALSVSLVASDTGGAILARETVLFSKDQSRADATLVIPAQLRGRAAKLSVEGARSAAATYILDARSARPLVGLIDTPSVRGNVPFQTPQFYLQRALAPYASVERGDIAALLKEGPALLLLPDTGRLPSESESALKAWIDQGGLLVRFSGPAMLASSDAQQDLLVPAPLRSQARIVGGALSWSSALKMAPFADDSPFSGLQPAEDITVDRQVMARNNTLAQSQIWATLTDGTPLVSTASMGTGRIVLFHTSADPQWSNLAISGTFVEMLQRLLHVLGPSQAAPSAGARDMSLTQLIDGRGSLTAPPESLAAKLYASPSTKPASPENPPGLYESQNTRLALNLASAAGPLSPRSALRPMQKAAGALEIREVGGVLDRSLQPRVFALIAVLIVMDAIACLLLRGAISRPRGSLAKRLLRPATAAAAFVLALVLVSPQTQARTPAQLAENVRLACVATGAAKIDALCLSGMDGLVRQLNLRTSVWTGQTQVVDLADENLGLFPLLYWPLQAAQPALSAEQSANLNAYMRGGGMLVIDLGAGVEGNARMDTQLAPAELLSDLRSKITFPPLSPLTKEHVLTHSFYILSRTPGRRGDGQLWLEAGGEEQGATVSPIVLGNADWLSSWANVQTNLPGYSGGDGRRDELAVRFGINLVMYALTGTYKADQVHLPALLERVGRGD
ncbi:MAG: DUF4159 domain-containing protein [Pseudomonadota bacterium]